MKNYKKGNKMFLVGMAAMVLAFGLVLDGCTSTGSVKGTMTTIFTLTGDALDALILVDNMWESAKLAKTAGGDYILYANMKTNGNTRPGSVILYIDDEKFDITAPSDWRLDDVDTTPLYQYEFFSDSLGTSSTWSTYKPLSKDAISALSQATTVTIRAVNSNAYLAKGIDISSILPKIKTFIGQ